MTTQTRRDVLVVEQERRLLSGDAERALKRQQLLDAFSRGASYYAAAQYAGITRMTIYNWRNADEDFARAIDDAIQAGTDAMEDEAKRRAMGWEEKIYDKEGNEVGARAVHSDRLMEFLLSGRRPEKFRAPKGDVHVYNSNIQNTATINALLTPEASKLLEAVALSKQGGFERGSGET